MKTKKRNKKSVDVKSYDNPVTIAPTPQEEKAAKTSGDWAGLACSWYHAHNPSDADATRCIKKAEELAKDVLDLVYCAVMCNDKQKVRSLMKKAVLWSKSSSDWRLCAISYNGFNKNESRKCLKKSVELIKNPKDHAACDNVRRQFDEEISIVDAPIMNDISAVSKLCAKGSNYRYNEKIDKMRKCMKKAESLSKTTQDWLDCAYAFAEYHDPMPVDSKRCMYNAEKLSKTTNDWCACARLWNYLRDLSCANNDNLPSANAKRCLRKAEKFCETPGDWCECASGYQNDKKNYKRCLEQATKIAKTASDWSQCANRWVDHEKKEEIRCLKKMEELIRFGDCSVEELILCHRG